MVKRIYEIVMSISAVGIILFGLYIATHLPPGVGPSKEDQLEEQVQSYRKVVYTQCESVMYATDTGKRTALLTVQAIFLKKDQLSLAPTNPFKAVMVYCNAYADREAQVETFRLQGEPNPRDSVDKSDAFLVDILDN